MKAYVDEGREGDHRACYTTYHHPHDPTPRSLPLRTKQLHSTRLPPPLTRKLRMVGVFTDDLVENFMTSWTRPGAEQVNRDVFDD